MRFVNWRRVSLPYYYNWVLQWIISTGKIFFTFHLTSEWYWHWFLWLAHQIHLSTHFLPRLFYSAIELCSLPVEKHTILKVQYTCMWQKLSSYNVYLYSSKIGWIKKHASLRTYPTETASGHMKKLALLLVTFSWKLIFYTFQMGIAASPNFGSLIGRKVASNLSMCRSVNVLVHISKNE